MGCALGAEHDASKLPLLFFTDETDPAFLTKLERLLQPAVPSGRVFHGDALLAKALPPGQGDDSYVVYAASQYVREHAERDFRWDAQKCTRCAERVR